MLWLWIETSQGWCRMMVTGDYGRLSKHQAVSFARGMVLHA